MSKLRPEALRLARMIEHYNAGVGSQRIVEDYQQAADELRRLYFENEKLRAALAEQEPVEIEMPEYHSHGMGCGLEDRGITDRYEAMEYGWYEAIDRVKEELANFGPLYTAPQPVKQPLTDEEIDNTIRKQVDDLLDHIYEYGTAAEGIDYRVRAIARAIEAAVWGEKA